MAQIGEIVLEFRTKRKMSRKELAAGICTEKYLYLIEKNDRSPSAEVLRLLSNRLGVNLFEYYEYLDCKEPSKVRKAMYQCARLRRTSGFSELKEHTEAMKALPDFADNPWRYEVLTNQYLIMLYHDLNIEDAIEGINDVLDHLEPEYADEEFTARFYAMLSTGYQMMHDIENATRACENGRKIISHTKNNSRYNQIHVSLSIATIALALSAGDGKKAIAEGLALVKYQEMTSAYERCNITYYFLACAYLMNGEDNVAFQWLEKSIHDLLVQYCPSMAYLIYRTKMFKTFVSHPKMNPTLLAWLIEKYDFMIVKDAKTQ
jgi:transcriptional regulator with XRE-family HTH domain